MKNMKLRNKRGQRVIRWFISYRNRQRCKWRAFVSKGDEYRALDSLLPKIYEHFCCVAKSFPPPASNGVVGISLTTPVSIWESA